MILGSYGISGILKNHQIQNNNFIRPKEELAI
jgi:hypothetical protein